MIYQPKKVSDGYTFICDNCEAEDSLVNEGGIFFCSRCKVQPAEFGRELLSVIDNDVTNRTQKVVHKIVNSQRSQKISQSTTCFDADKLKNNNSCNFNICRKFYFKQ